MRIPHIINQNTFKAYIPSPESLNLVHEPERVVHAEDFEWNAKHCPPLADLCVEAINKNFENEQLLDELECPDRNYLLEILDTNLPLELTIPLIDEEIYWERRYKAKFGEMILYRLPAVWTWKTLYMERHMREIIEQAQPEHNDELDMGEITQLCSPYVKRLLITQLQMWKPPLHWDEEDIPEVHPIDHIDFGPIFKHLTNVEEFDLVYGMNKVGEKFHWNMFKLSVTDCQKLGKAVLHLKALRILRIHKSRLEDAHTRVLMQGLIKNQTIEELDLSHCNIGDEGAICIAKLLTMHPKLRILNLCDNRIAAQGSEGIGFALLSDECRLQRLNLKLNPLHEEGAMGIWRAVVRGTTLEELSMAACQFDGECPTRLGQMLKLNTSLKRLDVSNNWLDRDGGKQLLECFEVNKTLHWLDVRETDITQDQQILIKKYLLRNRLGKEEIDESSEESSDEENSAEEEEEEKEAATATDETEQADQENDGGGGVESEKIDDKSLKL